MPELTSVIAHDTVLATCGHDADILALMVSGILARLPRDLGVLRGAVGDGDLARIREAAHRLYGMVAAFSTLAGDEASAIEDRAEQGDGAPIEGRLARLEAILTELTRELPDITVSELEARTEPP